MSDYEFCVSLSITHPDITPDEITEVLNITPSGSHIRGEPRVSPKGVRVGGVYEDNFWRAKMHLEDRLASPENFLEDYLSKINGELSVHKSYFSGLVKSGGYIEYFIGWFERDHNLMATLSPELLRTTGELHIAIGIDAYTE